MKKKGMSIGGLFVAVIIVIIIIAIVAFGSGETGKTLFGWLNPHTGEANLDAKRAACNQACYGRPDYWCDNRDDIIKFEEEDHPLSGKYLSCSDLYKRGVSGLTCTVPCKETGLCENRWKGTWRKDRCFAGEIPQEKSIGEGGILTLAEVQERSEDQLCCIPRSECSGFGGSWKPECDEDREYIFPIELIAESDEDSRSGKRCCVPKESV